MDISSLIRKVDQDRKQLPTYPSLKELILTKSVYQNGFIMQLQTVLSGCKDNVDIQKLKQAVNESQLLATKSRESFVNKGENIKNLNQRDQPKKLLEKLKIIREQISDAKISFLTKKRLYRVIDMKESKYINYANLIESSKQVSRKLSSFAENNISQRDIDIFKDKLKELGYYECVIENTVCRKSIMPELLNKKHSLEGEEYE
ncbi:hypothetical protein [Francisella sp. SYW-9]|uniref:hypothetical protein n=1 Tax=Francisella sp. SYW-9 TaxID=2610888 RepID=UPI00123D2053|nr:hypothetical protein [Francisella sp. SYW-9]